MLYGGSMTESLTYQGKLCTDMDGESYEAVWLTGMDHPLVKEVAPRVDGRQVSARYWITDKEVTRDEAVGQYLKTLFGDAEAEFMAHYSDITGYLWTDEDLMIGGHDLEDELRSSVGKWLILEIDVH